VLDGWLQKANKPGAGWAIKEESTYSGEQFQDEIGCRNHLILPLKKK
jgi:hypothetical protein